MLALVSQRANGTIGDINIVEISTICNTVPAKPASLQSSQSVKTTSADPT